MEICTLGLLDILTPVISVSSKNFPESVPRVPHEGQRSKKRGVKTKIQYYPSYRHYVLLFNPWPVYLHGFYC